MFNHFYFNYSQWKELRSLRQRETNDDVFFLEVAPRHRRTDAKGRHRRGW